MQEDRGNPTASREPEPLELEPLAVSALARRYSLRLQGDDVEVTHLSPLSRAHRPHARLTWANTRPFLDQFVARGAGACIAPARLAGGVPDGARVLFTEADPEEVFFSIFADLAEAGAWRRQTGWRGEGVEIGSGAFVDPSAILGDGCRIMPNAVVLGNVRLGDRSVVKPNATLGADGFEARRIHGRRRIVPHVGGVWAEDDVEIGASACVDRGLWGDYTFLGAETKVDSLAYVAHGVRVGRSCSLVGCSEVSGSAVLEDGVWLGPHTAVNQLLRIGAGAVVGTGAVVTRDLPAHALAYGSPAKVHGWACGCRGKLDFAGGGSASCERCQLRYVMVDGVPSVAVRA